MDIEIIEENEVVFAKRGRKSNADPKTIEIFSNIKIGQLVQIKELKIDSKMGDEKTIANYKAKVSAQLRSIASAANWENVSVKWDVNGIPTVKRLAK